MKRCNCESVFSAFCHCCKRNLKHNNYHAESFSPSFRAPSLGDSFALDCNLLTYQFSKTISKMRKVFQGEPQNIWSLWEEENLKNVFDLLFSGFRVYSEEDNLTVKSRWEVMMKTFLTIRFLWQSTNNTQNSSIRQLQKRLW